MKVQVKGIQKMYGFCIIEQSLNGQIDKNVFLLVVYIRKVLFLRKTEECYLKGIAVKNKLTRIFYFYCYLSNLVATLQNKSIFTAFESILWNF